MLPLVVCLDTAISCYQKSRPRTTHTPHTRTYRKYVLCSEPTVTEMSVYGTPLSILKLLPFAFHAVFVIFANLLRLLLYLQWFRNVQVFYFLPEIRNKQVYSWEMLHYGSSGLKRMSVAFWKIGTCRHWGFQLGFLCWWRRENDYCKAVFQFEAQNVGVSNPCADMNVEYGKKGSNR